MVAVLIVLNADFSKDIWDGKNTLQRRLYRRSESTEIAEPLSISTGDVKFSIRTIIGFRESCKVPLIVAVFAARPSGSASLGFPYALEIRIDIGYC